MTDEMERDPRMAALFPLDERAGPAKRIRSSASDALVGSVLDAWQAGPGPAPAGGETGSGGGTAAGGAPVAAGRGAVVRRLAVGASALVLLAGVAVYVGTRETPTRSVVQQPSIEVAPAARAPEPAAPIAEAAPSVEPAPEVASAPEPRAPARPDARSVEPREAEDLLATANGLRREGRYAEAESTYMRLVSLAPRSREAHVARVAAATLRLDRLDDPRGAARLFQAALRSSSGSLAAEAAFGLARASRATGDRAAERRALEEVVSHHSGSPYAGLAARRLAELGGGGSAADE